MKEIECLQKQIHEGRKPSFSLSNSFLKLGFETLGKTKKKPLAEILLYCNKENIFVSLEFNGKHASQGRRAGGSFPSLRLCWQGWHEQGLCFPQCQGSLDEQHHRKLSEHEGRRASGPAWEPLEPAQLPAAMNCKTTSLRLTGFSCRGYNTKLEWCYPASQITYASQLLKVVADISRQVSNTLVLIQKYSSSSLQQSLADHLQFGCKASAVNSHYPTHSYN